MKRSFLSGCCVVAVAVGVIAVVASGCSDRYGGCENVGGGVSVTCTDARTRLPVCDATVVVVSGTYRETLAGPGDVCMYSGVGTRPGTYEVTTSAPGYKTQVVEGVTLTPSSDGCFVVGGQVDVALVPIGDAGSELDAGADVSEDGSLDATSFDSSLLDASDD